jgi:hypothetical protein
VLRFGSNDLVRSGLVGASLPETGSAHAFGGAVAALGTNG